MFGYHSWDEIWMRPVESLYAPEYGDLFADDKLIDHVGNSLNHSHEIRAIKKDGLAFSASIWMRAIEFRGEPALLGFLVDVSEEKALRSQLLLAQKMETLGTLAGGIAHDFNNILFAIMGYTELSIGLVPKGTKLYEDLQAVLKAANRARDLVSQILTFSRQKGDLKRSPLRIEPIVKETLKFLRGTIPATISIKQVIAQDLGAIMASSTQIHQLLMNLCTNAAHAMRETGGVLSLRVDQVTIDHEGASRHPDQSPGEYVRIAVSDTGQGMPPDVLQRIFEPYFTTKEQGEGTGLGLAVVHGVVKSHQGTLAVQSEIGKGTTFEVLLPVILDPPVEDVSTCAGPEIGNESILLVDDDHTLTDMTKKVLASLGYRVTTEPGSIEALELFRSRPFEFDLVITDMTTPHMTGKDLAREMRSIRPDIPIILCTGYSDLINDEQARDMGIASLVIKPLLKNELAETIRRVLDRRHAPN